MVYGRPPPLIARFILRETPVEAMMQDLMNKDEALRQLKFNLQRARAQMTIHANVHCKPSKIKLGDWVYLNHIDRVLCLISFIPNFQHVTVDLTIFVS